MPLTYHPVSMTINGVTKSVMVPLPKPRSDSQPVTAKLPDGTAVIMTPDSRIDNSTVTVVDKTNVVLTTTNASSTSVSGQRAVGVLVPFRSSSDKRPIVTVNPVSRYKLLPRQGAPVISERLTQPKPKFNTQESTHRRILQITPPTAVPTVRCVQLPSSLSHSQPTISLSQRTQTRPIILRRNVVPAAAVSRSSCTVVVRPRLQSSTTSVAKVVPSSTLTVLSSNPRTLSRSEAIAAGWFAGGDNDEIPPLIQTTSVHSRVVDPCAAAADECVVRHITPMDTTTPDSLDKLTTISTSNSNADKLYTSCTEDSQILDERTVLVDNDTKMKVIEIFPDSGDDDDSDRSEEEAAKPAVLIKNELSNNAVEYDGITSRNASSTVSAESLSTETAMSDPELFSRSTGTGDFVVLAEWSQDEVPAEDAALKKTARRQKRRKRKSRRAFPPRRSPRPTSVTVFKARRTGGRPKTATERHGIVDCFVSLPVFELTKSHIDVRSWWRYVCCRNQTQSCRCSSLQSSSTPVSTQRSSNSVESTTLTANFVSNVQEQGETSELVKPSMITSDCTTLPVQMSGPTSDDGVTPLLVRRPDGKLASVVAKRTSPSGTASGKKKYLLIKTKTGSYLVPVNTASGISGLSGESAVTVPSPTAEKQTTSPSPVPPSVPVKPATVTDASGHRQRIQELKAQLRQQEEQLNSIRSQLTCSAVKKFDFDSNAS